MVSGGHWTLIPNDPWPAMRTRSRVPLGMIRPCRYQGNTVASKLLGEGGIASSCAGTGERWSGSPSMVWVEIRRSDHRELPDWAVHPSIAMTCIKAGFDAALA